MKTTESEFFQLECRTWVWWPDKTRGAFCAENLRQIADELEKQNMKTQTEELQKELEQAELEKIRAIDRVKDLKARISEAEKEPSIYELMPIGSVWCGWEVVRHDKEEERKPIGLTNHLIDFVRRPQVQALRKLIAEQRRIDAMKRALDAVSKYCNTEAHPRDYLLSVYKDYKKIIEKEEI